MTGTDSPARIVLGRVGERCAVTMVTSDPRAADYRHRGDRQYSAGATHA